MQLREIYQPIRKELNEIEQVLKTSLKSSRYKSISEINNYLLDTQGKKLRPALLILSAKATSNQRLPLNTQQLTKIASAIELIHMASLIHDDVVDHATLRHNKLSINAKWGEDVSIALGDYLYAVGFALISSCRNTDILSCISLATKAMCEGELMQICERDNLDLLKERYITIVKNKTAGLFAASCQAGAMLSHCPRPLVSALKEYGLNFGTAFQIIDDYLDLVGGQEKLGKTTGQDLAMGEITLPILNLLDSVAKDERRELIKLLDSKPADFQEKIKTKLFNSKKAVLYTKKIASGYLDIAKRRVGLLPDSGYRKSLIDLTDFIQQRAGF